MSSGILPDASALAFEVTVTLTTAGVPLAARVSIALSRASSELTLSTSSGAAEGAAAAALAAVGFMHSYVVNEAIASASAGSDRRRVHFFVLPFRGFIGAAFPFESFINN